MTIVRDHRSVHPTEGIKPVDMGVTNRSQAAAFSLGVLGGYVNSILTKRLKTHFTWWTDQSNGANPDSPVRILFHTSPNVFGFQGDTTYVRMRLVLAPGRYDAATLPSPRLDVVVTNVTESRTVSVAPPTLYNNYRDDNIGPEGFRAYDLDIPLDSVGAGGRDSTFSLQLTTHDQCQVVSLTLFEVTRQGLDPAADIVVEGNQWYVGGRVYDGDLVELWAAMARAYDRQGSVLVAWAPMTSTYGAALVADSYVNVFPMSLISPYSAYDPDAPGFWAWPEKHGTLTSNNFGVVLWVAVDATSTATGQVQFVTYYGVIGTIDIQPYATASIVYQALQVTWPNSPAAIAALKIDVLGRVDITSPNIKIYGLGVYEQEALDPRSIPGLAVWLAADRLVGLADGDPVASWLDASGQANHFAQATGGSKPTYKSGILSGKPVVRFDGTADFMSCADSASYKADKLTVFVVVKRTGSNADNVVICYPHAGTHTSPFFRWAIDAQPTALSLPLDSSSYAPAADTTLWRVWSYATWTRGFYRDGYVQGFGTSSHSVTYPTAVGLYLGADVAGGETFAGDIAEILIFARDLTEAEQWSIGEMLSQKYGLQRGPT